MLGPSIHFSIITVTFNTAECLPRLIDSLKPQSDLDFQWVVADGGSTDETLALLRYAVKSLNVTVGTRSNFEVYDALSIGV